MSNISSEKRTRQENVKSFSTDKRLLYLDSCANGCRSQWVEVDQKPVKRDVRTSHAAQSLVPRVFGRKICPVLWQTRELVSSKRFSSQWLSSELQGCMTSLSEFSAITHRDVWSSDGAQTLSSCVRSPLPGR